MDEDTRRAILAEIAATCQLAVLKPWQFTAYQFAEQAGVTLNLARKYLEREIAAGRMQTALVWHNGKRVRAYWRPQDERDGAG